MNINNLSRGVLSVIGTTLLSLAIAPQGFAQTPLTPEKDTLVATQLQNLSVPPLEGFDTYLPTAPVEIRLVLRLSDRRVYVYHNDKVQASYPVAIGRQGWETPTGEFAVLQMIQNPSWENPFTGEVIPPGPENPLGVGWVGFWTDGKNYIGFHGTPNEDLIGQAVSHGCVRMKNADLVKLYEQVQMGTLVTVQP